MPGCIRSVISHTLLVFLLALLATLPLTGCGRQTPPEAQKIRMIVETDAGGDPDDEQSLVRFLLYLNEWDVEGIIATRPQTRANNPNPNPDGITICRAFLAAYEEVFPTLSTHADGFPSPDYLRKRTVAGYNDIDHGVELIIRAVDSPDPRPVWFSNWGTDDNTVSSLKRALDKVLAERGPDGYAMFKNKIRLCSDDKFEQHSSTTTPRWKLWVYTKMPDMDGGRWYHRFAPLTATAGGFDIEADVRTDHGPLGSLYAVTAGVSGEPQKEGDTPEFLYLIPTGMNDVTQPTWGSWAGRFGVRNDSSFAHNANWYAPNLRDNLNGTINRDNTLSRWAVHIQNDFKARMDWCVSTYEAANHPPSPSLNGDGSAAVMHLNVKAGTEIKLSAAGSTDPDGDKLRFQWFCYLEAGSYGRNVEISDADSEQCEVSIPRDAVGRTIHVVLVCTDSGSPSLTRYRRVVLNVR